MGGQHGRENGSARGGDHQRSAPKLSLVLLQQWQTSGAVYDTKIYYLHAPITKKNSQQILTNHRTGKPFIAPSRQYKNYEQAAMWYLTPKPKTPLAGRYRVATVFYMPTRRRVDLTNLMEAAHDTLVAAKILADDNNTVIASVDGSRVLYDKANPRTEIFIKEMPDDDQPM